MTWKIPYEFGNLDQLGHLYIDDNSLTGTIPPTITKMTSLYSFHLRRNSFTGSVPEGLYDMASLFSLELTEGNLLVGAIPDVYFVEESKLHYGAN